MKRIFVAGQPLLSPYRTNKLVQKHYGVKTETYQVCPTRAHMFYNANQDTCTCQKNDCEQDSEPGIKPTTTQIPLYRQLATFFNTSNSREQLLYRAKWSQPRNASVYRDIFDGKTYQRHKHLFENEFDLALALYIDGFSPQKRGSVTMVTFMAVILNLPPDVR